MKKASLFKGGSGVSVDARVIFFVSTAGKILPGTIIVSSCSHSWPSSAKHLVENKALGSCQSVVTCTGSMGVKETYHMLISVHPIVTSLLLK